VAIQIFLRQLAVSHRIAAGEQSDVVGAGLLEPRRDFGIEREHLDPRTVGDDFDIDVVLAQFLLDVLGVVQRKIPYCRIVFADLNHDTLLAGPVRGRGGDGHSGETLQQRTDDNGTDKFRDNIHGTRSLLKLR